MNEQKESTRAKLLRLAAPFFNKRGYVAASFTELEGVTGYTKGAIYRHFGNKEHFALECFKTNLKKVIEPLAKILQEKEKALDKLLALTAYYKQYYQMTQELGGCPLLRIGVDAQHNQANLFEFASQVTWRLERDLMQILEEGQKQGSIQPSISAQKWAKTIFSMIEGSIFLAFLHQDGQYMDHTMDHIEEIIQEKISL